MPVKFLRFRFVLIGGIPYHPASIGWFVLVEVFASKIRYVVEITRRRRLGSRFRGCSAEVRAIGRLPATHESHGGPCQYPVSPASGRASLDSGRAALGARQSGRGRTATDSTGRSETGPLPPWSFSSDSCSRARSSSPSSGTSWPPPRFRGVIITIEPNRSIRLPYFSVACRDRIHRD